MKKRFRIEDLDCAHCAAKMETAIQKLDGVTSCSVNILTLTLTLEADDSRFGEIAKQAAAICKKIEPDCKVRI